MKFYLLQYIQNLTQYLCINEKRLEGRTSSGRTMVLLTKMMNVEMLKGCCCILKIGKKEGE